MHIPIEKHGLFNKAQAAKVLGLPTGTFKYWVLTGKLPKPKYQPTFLGTTTKRKYYTQKQLDAIKANLESDNKNTHTNEPTL